MLWRRDDFKNLTTNKENLMKRALNSSPSENIFVLCQTIMEAVAYVWKSNRNIWNIWARNRNITADRVLIFASTHRNFYFSTTFQTFPNFSTTFQDQKVNFFLLSMFPLPVLYLWYFCQLCLSWFCFQFLPLIPHQPVRTGHIENSIKPRLSSSLNKNTRDIQKIFLTEVWAWTSPKEKLFLSTKS